MTSAQTAAPVPPVETAALVALLRTPNAAPSAYAELVEDRGSALAVLEREGRGANLARPRLFENETMQQRLATATADLARWRAQGIRALTVLDPDYPDNLRGVHDRPPLIFVAGALEPRDALSVAIIGTRRASRAGLAQARAIAHHLVDAGYTLVSGLAAGIDTAVHRAALAAGGRTLAVIGTGLGRCYPPQNARLQQSIAHTAAVISQFWPGAPPSRESFPMRNAVMSGLSVGTVIVEAGMVSGARIQARLALSHGRPVFLLDALLSREAWARELAAKPGVHVIRQAEEVIATLERLATEAPLTP